MLRKSSSPKEECSVLPYTQHTQSYLESFPALDISYQPSGACRSAMLLKPIGCPREVLGVLKSVLTLKESRPETNASRQLLEA